jgi:hypothetical protein
MIRDLSDPWRVGGPLGIEAPNHLSPFAVVGGLPFAAVSTGRTHTCGVTVSGEA